MEAWKKILTATVLTTVAVVAHRNLIPVSLELWNWDVGVHNLVAEDFLHGKFTAFVYQHSYGGTVLSFFHALWLWLSPTVIEGHLSFPFVFVPVLLTVSTFLLLIEFTSLVPALLVCMIPALGLQSWVVWYSATEYYVASFVFGCILLILRKRWGSPWDLRSPSKLILFGAVSGLSVYTFRASLIYVVGVCLPWTWLKGEMGIFRRKPWLLVPFIIYAAFEFFPELGFRGKPVLGVFLLLTLFIWSLEKRGQWRSLLRPCFLLFFLGFLIGLAPEIVSALHASRIPEGNGNLATLPVIFRTMLTLPDQLRQLLTSTTESPFFETGRTPLHLACLVLGMLGIFSLFRRIRRIP